MFSRNKPKKTLPLSESPSAPVGIFKDPRDEFAEIYGSSKVSSQRMFVVSILAIGLAVVAVSFLFINAQKSVAIPLLVEFNDTGVVNKPVRIESIRPTQAVIKAELARWVVKVFTIDSIQTPQFFREANAMTKGLGTQQFTEFRVNQNIINRMTKDQTLQRKVTVSSVDVSQDGVAFIFLSTQEAKGAETNAASARFRATLKYELISPDTESAIMANPLGIFITSMNITEEAAAK